MTRRFAAILSLLAFAAVVVACGASTTTPPTVGPSAATAEPPVPTPPSPPGPTPEPSPTPAPLLRTSGWLVYLRHGDLYVGALDGSGELRLTTNSLGAGYAGYVRDGDDTWIYYTSVTSSSAPTLGAALGTAQLLRRRLGSAEEDHLADFDAASVALNGDATSSIASVSPDGRSVAYADVDGISVIDLASGRVSRWLSNGCYDERGTPGSSPCEKGVAFLAPQWSPDNAWLAAAEIPYEGSTLTLVPSDNPASYRTVQVGAYFKSWAPGRSRLCVPQSTGVGYGVAGVYDVAQSAFTPLSPAASSLAAVSSCVWDTDGTIAVAGGADEIDHAAFFDSTGQPIASYPLGPIVGVSAWLPDGSGVVVSRARPGTDWVNPQVDLDNEIVMLDGTTRALAVSAGRVLGAIPPTPPTPTETPTATR